MASRQFENEEAEGIVGLVRETLDGLRTLIADHIKLARIELEADLKTYAAGAAVLLVAGGVVAIGYIFGWIAIALCLARAWGIRGAFGAVAGLHIVLGFVAILIATGKMKRTKLMHGTATEARTSVMALRHPLHGRTS